MIHTDNSTHQFKTNVTSDNMNDVSLGPVALVFNYATLVIGLVIIVCEIFAVDVLRRCKRMPYFSRILSTGFILSDAAGSIVFTVHQIMIFAFGINNNLTHNLRTLSVGTVLTISWAFVASMSVERVVALKANIKYMVSAKKSRVRAITASIWLFHIFFLVGVILAGFKQHCDLKMDNCDVWKASKIGRVIMMAFLVVYEITLAISYIIIYRIAARHVRAIAAIRSASFGQTVNNCDEASERQFSTTEAIIKIVLAFMLLHAPIIVHLFIFESDIAFRNETVRRALYAFSYLCIQVNSFVSLRLYVIKFDECKLYFYQSLSRAFKSYKGQAEELRIKVFNIVVSTESERTGPILKK